jgi:hypothetical protein
VTPENSGSQSENFPGWKVARTSDRSLSIGAIFTPRIASGRIATEE